MLARIAFPVFFAFFTSQAFAAQMPSEVPSPVSRIYVPYGFDDNDNVEIVMSGDFQDACYQVGRAGADVNEETKHITVWASAYVFPRGTYCAQTLTPFVQSVRVGMLKPGHYTVSYRYDAGIQSPLDVRAHTVESPDEFLYAPVENAGVFEDAQSGDQTLFLQGHYPYMFIGCMRIKEVRMIKRADVLVVQPITEILEDKDCQDIPADHSYSMTVKVTEPFTERGLLHVRALNGDTINRLIQP